MKSKSHMIHKAAVKRIAKRPTKETMGKPSKPSSAVPNWSAGRDREAGEG
jgi:histone H3/H4